MGNYTQYRPLMKTGDVIAFSGQGKVAEIIKWKTRSIFSHVGIVLDTAMDGFGKVVMLVESSARVHLPDTIRRELVSGVQIHLLSSRIALGDEVWWIPLKQPLPELRKLEMQRWIRKKHYEHTPYDAIQAIGAGADFLDKLGLTNTSDFNSLFCSELVSKALQIAEAIPASINPSEQTPADVVSYKCFESAIKLH